MDKLHSWFSDLLDDFGPEEVPSSEKIDLAINTVFDHFGVQPIKYLGSGDNGFAIRVSDGSVIKFTIDAGEAILWNKLKDNKLEGVPELSDVVLLSSSIIGDTPIYVLKVDFVPDPVTKEQGELIRRAVKWARAKTDEDVAKAGNRSIYKQRRILNFIKAFDKLAEIDKSFRLVSDLFMDLADKVGAYIFDIQPDNFRVNDSGDVILVDPSVPDLFGDFQDPKKLLYEERLDFIGVYNILFYE
jgi:hypothetical protein